MRGLLVRSGAAVRRPWFIILSSIVVVVGVAAGVSLLCLIGIPMLLPPPGEMYPRAPAMPPTVPETAGDLLSRFERILRDRALKFSRPCSAG